MSSWPREGRSRPRQTSQVKPDLSHLKVLYQVVVTFFFKFSLKQLVFSQDNSLMAKSEELYLVLNGKWIGSDIPLEHVIL